MSYYKVYYSSLIDAYVSYRRRFTHHDLSKMELATRKLAYFTYDREQ